MSQPTIKGTQTVTEQNMDECALRLECLKLAHHPDALNGETEALARDYVDFVLGTNDVEIIHITRELTKKVTETADGPDRLKTASELYGKIPPFVPLSEQSE